MSVKRTGRRTAIGCLAAAFAASATPALAQYQAQYSGDPFEARTASEPQFAIRLSVPLGVPRGARRDTPRDKARLSFGLQTEVAPRPDAAAWTPAPVELRRSEIGLSLSETPQLMLNGQPLLLEALRQDVSGDDAKKVGTGVLIGVGVSVAALLIAAGLSG